MSTVVRRPGRLSTGPRTGPGRCRRRPYRALSRVGQWHARAHAVRPQPGRFVCPQAAEVAIPAGYRPVTDRAAAAAFVDELPDAALLYANALATRRAVWAALVEHMNPDTGLITVGQAVLGQRASAHRGRPVPRSTVGRHVRALVDAGVLHIAQYGASRHALGADRDRAPTYLFLAPLPADDGPEAPDVPLTPGQLAQVDRLRAALETATTPAAGSATPVDENGHLPEGSAPTRVGDITQPRKSEVFASSPRLIRPSEAERAGPTRRERPERYTPRTASERQIAIAWLGAVMGWATRSRFAALIDKELSVIAGPFFAAGWSPQAVVRAWQIQPDGTPWPGPLPTPDQRDSANQPRIRNLAAVLTSRLKAWRDPLGHPLDPPIPTERPRRGRPRKAPAPPAAPPAPVRGEQAEAEYTRARAALEARNAARHAQRRAEQARTGVRQAELRDRLHTLTRVTAPAPDDPAPPVTAAADPHPGELIFARALIRARLERGKPPRMA